MPADLTALIADLAAETAALRANAGRRPGGHGQAFAGKPGSGRKPGQFR
jgi:hypothetical protein